jgi:hypothetical protein
MAQETPPPDASPKISGWAIGGVSFASVILIMVGIFQILDGLAAIIKDEFFVVTDNFAFNLDVTAWGWIHLAIGVLVLIIGLSLLTGKAWAAVAAIFIAVLSAVANFFFIPYYPWWSLLMIALAVWVIWSLTRPGVVTVE